MAEVGRGAPQETLNAALERAAGFPEAGLRLLDRRERARFLSWAELERRAAAVAGGLRELGIRRGEPVPLIHPTGEAFFSAFFGILLAGAVPVPLYPPVRLGRLEEYHRRTAGMLRAVGARLLLADARVRHLLGETLELHPPSLGCLTLEELPQAPPQTVAADPSDLALVQFSSGTTVDPKPVALSQRAVMAQTRALNGYWPDTPELRHSGASWLPLYHDMGLIGCVFPALERPSVLTLLPPELFVASPAAWLRAIARYRATISPAPNFAYALCLRKVRDQELAGVDLSCWRVALNGAEPVTPETLRAFARRFRPWGFRPEALTPVYGLSEAALAVTFSSPEEPFRSRRLERRALAERGEAVDDREGLERVSVGRPLPGFEVEVRDEEGGPLPSGRAGRVWVRGPSLMEGYLGRPRESARVLRQGWLDTGDLGFLLEGELYLTGRAKDLIKQRGQSHAPDEVEEPAGRVEGVRPGCVAAVSDLPEGREEEELLVLVERARGAPAPPEKELARRVREAVLAAAGLRVDRVVVLEAGTLPRTSSGKIRRGEALHRLRLGELRPPEPPGLLGLAKRAFRSRRVVRKLNRGGTV